MTAMEALRVPRSRKSQVASRSRPPGSRDAASPSCASSCCSPSAPEPSSAILGPRSPTGPTG